jgi:hypothetical protein
MYQSGSEENVGDVVTYEDKYTRMMNSQNDSQLSVMECLQSENPLTGMDVFIFCKFCQINFLFL